MLTCREVIWSLSDYLEGKVAIEVSQQINWHLGHCPDCKRMLRSAQRALREHFALSAEVARASHGTDV